jgi:hypothetical protein
MNIRIKKAKKEIYCVIYFNNNFQRKSSINILQMKSNLHFKVLIFYKEKIEKTEYLLNFDLQTVLDIY